MDQKPDIEKQLLEAQAQREKMLEQLRESEAVIASIEARLSEVTKSQEARLRADERVDNKLLDQVQSKKTTRSDLPLPKPKETEKKEPGKEQIMNGDTSWYEIIVDDDGTKHEHLREK